MSKMFQHKIYIPRFIQTTPVIEWDHPNKKGERMLSQQDIDAGYTTFTLRFKEYIDRSVDNRRQVFVVVENSSAVNVSWTQPNIKNHQTLHFVTMVIPARDDPKKRELNISRVVGEVAENYPFISTRLVNDIAHNQTKISRTKNNIKHLEDKLEMLVSQLSDLMDDNARLLEMAEEETSQGPPRMHSPEMRSPRMHSPERRPRLRPVGTRSDKPRNQNEHFERPTRINRQESTKENTRSGTLSRQVNTNKVTTVARKKPQPPQKQRSVSSPGTLEFVNNARAATAKDTVELINKLTAANTQTENETVEEFETEEVGACEVETREVGEYEVEAREAETREVGKCEAEAHEVEAHEAGEYENAEVEGVDPNTTRATSRSWADISDEE